MNRRAFVFASLAASVAVRAAHAAGDLRVILVGGQDCEPCHRWRTTYRNGWLASPEYRQVMWYEIDPPHLRDAYRERYWPETLQPVLAQVPRKSGTPRFLIVADGRIVSNEYGVSHWLDTMAALKQLLGE